MQITEEVYFCILYCLNTMMKELILNFPAQLKEAVNIAGKAVLSKPKTQLNKVLICGLGGSGIGGTIVKEILHSEANAPIDIIKSYSIPAYVDEHTLVICSSYSGNTEETLESYKQARERKAHIVCITSGGQLLEMAKQHGVNSIVIPGGAPPRACLGYSLTQLLQILAFHELAPNNIEHISAAVKLLELEQTVIMEEANMIATVILNTIPVIYSTSLHEGVAVRFRQQLNENAKILCWHHVIPEMNHNELVGWSRKYPEVSAIMFRDHDEHPRNEIRIDICRKIFGEHAGNYVEIYSKGKHTIEKKIYWIHMGDWISYYLSEKRHVDAMDIKVIDQLKKELAGK
jgi:glucose/mannose-6-phosphate isomerase